MTATDNLLLEIGTEELPASYVESALVALPEALGKLLGQARLSHSGLRSVGTPRRIAVLVEGLATTQPDLKERVVGPPIRIAYDAAGKPTKAAEAFARKLGCELEQLEREETPKGVYLAGTRQEVGRPAAQLLGALLREACAALTFRKSMRWSDGDTPFGRPIRWLVALFGDQIIDFEFAGIRSGAVTKGHRFLAPGEVKIPSAREYPELLRAAHVLVDPVERREAMLTQLRDACASAGTTLIEDAFLVRENLNLVEEPHVVVGHFDEAFLALPEDVILAVAKGHQRYFCARGAEGTLAPMYLAVVGTAVNPANVVRGNDRVMRARLSDGQFFFNEDMKVPLENRRSQLGGIVFQERLGTVLEKTDRIERLSVVLGQRLGMAAEVVETARQGARLCKCDLVTLMVGEFPELQGEMGRVYALGQGQPDAVADVIRSHYQPKGAADSTPSSDAAALVAMGDRLDTLVGTFAVGLSPTGTADPYALRRSCLGVLRTILDHGYGLSVRQVLESAYAGYEGRKLDLALAETVTKLGDFFRDRLRGILAERYPSDVVEACLASGYDEPTDTASRVRALAGLEPSVRSNAGEVFKRATNIAKEAPEGAPVDPASLSAEVHDSEKSLFAALGRLDADLQEAQTTRDFPRAFAAIADFAPMLGAFFENVFVMTEEMAVRQNRLRLMRAISERCSAVAHFNLLT